MKVTVIADVNDVTDELVASAVDIADGFFGEGSILWDDPLERLEDWENVDFGGRNDTAAIRALKAKVRRARKHG